MALTRAILKGMGITEKEIIDNIMEAHGETVESAKEKATATAEIKLQKTIDELQKKLDTPQKTEVDEDAKSKLETLTAENAKLKSEFDTYKASAETEKTTLAKETALAKALKDSGANEKIINLLQKEFDLSKVEFDGDKIKDWDSLVKPIKESYNDFFGKVEVEGYKPANPIKGDNTKPKDAFNFNFQKINKINNKEE